MSYERRQILQMLAEGKITADEAEKLLDALGEEPTVAGPVESASTENKARPKFLHIQVDGGKHCGGGRENVNIKVPIILLKAGMKLGRLVPGKARAKVSSHLDDLGLDIDLDRLDAKNIDIFLEALRESSIDIDSDKEKVRIYCC